MEAVRKVESVEPKAAIPDPNTIVIKLTTPVEAHGETIKELILRKPTGGDLMQLGEGYPIRFDYGGQVAIVPAVMGTLMAILAGVPPGTIRRLNTQDFAAAAFELMPLFMPGAQMGPSS